MIPKLSNTAARVAKEAKILPEELATMVKHSAPYTHEWANRRWHHWIMLVDKQKGELIRLALMPLPTQGSGVWEEHDDCDGEGCAGCGWTGEVWRQFN